MPEGLRVRPIAINETPIVESMQRRAYVEDDGQHDALESRIERDTRYLVAQTTHGDIPGCIGAVRPGAMDFYFERLIALGDPRLPPDATRDNTTEVDGLVVCERFRGRGYGRILSLAITLVMETLGAKYALGLCSSRSIGMAVETGYRPTGLRFTLGHIVEELVVGRVSELTAHARPWLQCALLDGRVRLAEPLLALLGASYRHDGTAHHANHRSLYASLEPARSTPC